MFLSIFITSYIHIYTYIRGTLSSCFTKKNRGGRDDKHTFHIFLFPLNIQYRHPGLGCTENYKQNQPQSTSTLRNIIIKMAKVKEELLKTVRGFPDGSAVKNPPANPGETGDMDSITELSRVPREGHGNPLQYSCWENLMDRGAWQAMVHGVAESWT